MTTTTHAPGHTDEREYLRGGEAAALLHVTRKAITRYAKQGMLPCLRTLGGQYLYPAAQIRQLAAQLTHRVDLDQVARQAESAWRGRTR